MWPRSDFMTPLASYGAHSLAGMCGENFYPDPIVYADFTHGWPIDQSCSASHEPTASKILSMHNDPAVSINFTAPTYNFHGDAWLCQNNVGQYDEDAGWVLGDFGKYLTPGYLDWTIVLTFNLFSALSGQSRGLFVYGTGEDKLVISYTESPDKWQFYWLGNLYSKSPGIRPLHQNAIDSSVTHLVLTRQAYTSANQAGALKFYVQGELLQEVFGLYAVGDEPVYDDGGDLYIAGSDENKGWYASVGTISTVQFYPRYFDRYDVGQSLSDPYFHMRIFPDMPRKIGTIEGQLSIKPAVEAGIRLRPAVSGSLELEPAVEAGVRIKPAVDGRVDLEPAVKGGMRIKPRSRR